MASLQPRVADVIQVSHHHVFLSERGSPLDVGGVVCMGRGVEPVVDRPSAVAHDIGVGAEEGRTAQIKPFGNGCRFTT